MNILSPSSLAQQLIANKIIELSPDSPFTFASGIKSPIYCDGRKVISLPKLRLDIAHSLADKIKQNFPDVEIISGVATGSIAMAAWVSQILDLPMIYYRKPKGYGHNNTVEGQYEKNQKVVVIEDTVSTGSSCITAVNSLRENGLDVLGVAFIYTHEIQSSVDNFASNNCKFVSLCGITDIIKYAHTSNILNEKQIELIKKWQQNPKEWQQNPDELELLMFL